MPSQGPIVFYAGLGPDQRPTLWISNRTTRQKSVATNDEYAAALSLAAMATGKIGNPWEAIYRQTPARQNARILLGRKIASAFRAASDQQALNVAKQVKWLQSHINSGLKRSAVYSLLKAHGLTAYNTAFIKGKPIQGEAAVPGHPGVGEGCDRTNISSGAWPYQGEPLPRQAGVCALLQAKEAPQNPEAQITLPGAFDMACSSTTTVTITFGSTDRVVGLQIDRPREVCV